MFSGTGYPLLISLREEEQIYKGLMMRDMTWQNKQQQGDKGESEGSMIKSACQVRDVDYKPSFNYMHQRRWCRTSITPESYLYNIHLHYSRSKSVVGVVDRILGFALLAISPPPWGNCTN
jgi:hypothetical protein